MQKMSRFVSSSYSIALLLFCSFFLIDKVSLVENIIIKIVILSLAYVVSAFAMCGGISKHISSFSYKNLTFFVFVVCLLVYSVIRNLFVIYGNQGVQDVCRVSCPLTFSSEDALLIDKERFARFAYAEYGVKVMLPSDNNVCGIYQPNSADVEKRNRKQVRKKWCDELASSEARDQKNKGYFLVGSIAVFFVALPFAMFFTFKRYLKDLS